MRFVQKILDTFKMKSTREMGSEKGKPEAEAYIEIFRANKPANIIDKITDKKKESIDYGDRFYEDYRPITRKAIAFTGNNFSNPAVQACAALIISGSVKKGEKIKPNDYYSYFERLYGVVNIRELHIWLYENNYLRKATPKEALNLYKVPELKAILDSMGLKKNGNKADLIERIAENTDIEMKEKLSSECDRYFRSEKGERFLSENEDYVLFHRKQYGVTFQEFCEHRILKGGRRKFYDTIFNVLSQKAYEYQVKGYISQLEWIYLDLSKMCYDQAKNSENSKDKLYTLSLENALYRLYLSTNLASKYYLFSIDNVKFDGIETAKHRILSEEAFNPYTMSRILELRNYFNEQMLDVVYAPEILPYCLFGKYDMLDVILDLYNGEFDAEFYTNHIKTNYVNYIKQFI